MARGRKIPKRVTAPDPIYSSELVSKFVNFLMERGKKTVAQKIVYGAMQTVADKKKGEALSLFEQVIDLVKPQVEVKSHRVGGANYQVPMPVASHRQSSLAFRWLIVAAKGRKNGSMKDRLAAEMLDALDGTGGALKKKEDVHRMAEANKAFAHFARFAR
jgi:small subunit ribosomal protein S7